MKKEDIKIEIQKILDKVPEDMLEEVFSILKEFSDKNQDTIVLSHNLNKILSEDKKLLERLSK